MRQFDLETDAALTQLNWEELSKTPGGEFVEIISDLIALTGVAGPLAIAGGASGLLIKVRKLAGASYTSNLIFTITAVRNDLATLYERHDNLHGRIDSLHTDPKFAEAISALALRAMHTSVKDRLKRLARIVVNGVKEDDLEPESLDDMMRAAVELKALDLQLLGDIYRALPNISHELQLYMFWENYWKEAPAKYAGKSIGSIASGFERLESHGLIFRLRRNAPDGSPTGNIHQITDDGKKFYQRLQEIAV
ncbi:MAG: hypothetical protein ABSF23_13395 [Terracidiphilus sp.]|jgi:hypothetical protein